METTSEFNRPTLAEYRAARFAYRVGTPIMPDDEYDILDRQIRQLYPDAEEVHQVYELDKINIDELTRFGIDPLTAQLYARARSYAPEFKYESTYALLSENNKSIISQKTEEEVFNRLSKIGKGVYRLSPKIDGLFTFLIYEKEVPESNVYNFVCAMTRGEEDSRIDITRDMSNIISTRIKMDGEANSIRINGEAIFDSRFLSATDYKTQRSACMGILNSTVNSKPELHQYIRFFAHGSLLSGTYSENLAKISGAGFETVPLHTWEFNSDTVEDTMFKLQPILNTIKLWEEEEQIDIDGIVAVLETEELLGETKTSGSKMYDSNVCALKIGYWNKGFYESTIIGILAEQQDDRVSYKLDIEPVIAANKNTLTKVTDINLSTLIRDNIRIGDKVAFKYMNDTTIKYLYKVVDEDGIDT